MIGRRARRGAVDARQFAIASLMIVTLLFVLSWLQGRFDGSDHKKAQKIVQTYGVRGGRNLVDTVLARHPGRARHHIEWESEIRQSCLGHVRVTARIPPRPGAPGTAYAFDVNLTGPSVHPTDPRTVEILQALTATTATTAAGRTDR